MWWDKKWVLACQSFGECPARVKLELTDFSTKDGWHRIEVIKKNFDKWWFFGWFKKNVLYKLVFILKIITFENFSFQSYQNL